MRRTLFLAVLFAAATVSLGFLVLPLAALFLRVSPGALFGQLANPVAVDALLVSLKTSAIAHALVLALCTPAAYLLATRAFHGRSLVLAVVELPLILPPAVAGIALFAAFGRFGLLGGTLDAIGVRIPLTQTAVVLAVAFVEAPFYLRGAVAAFETVDRALLEAARTLGAGPARVFIRVALPLALGGLGASSALALARGLGEFGATIIFAGSFQGVTQTLPLAIYAELARNFDTALAIGALFVLIGLALLVTLKVVPRWTRSTSTSLFPSAPSVSS
ncbi:MAG TPA: ABC transporter permease subunit [Gaiellaceae bacterium]|nr:ABC transporter permease subunit [Gaiellaceae bacterium]